MRRERAQSAQMQLTPRDPLERIREASTHPCRRHSPTRRALAHTQRLHAVREQRRKSQFQMQHTRLELQQVHKHLSCQYVALTNQLRQSRQELRIFQLHQSISVPHAPCLACVILARALPSRRGFWRQNGSKLDPLPETRTSRNLAQAHH